MTGDGRGFPPSDEPGQWGPPIIIRRDKADQAGKAFQVRNPPGAATPHPGDLADGAQILTGLFREMATACGFPWTPDHDKQVQRAVNQILDSAAVDHWHE